MSLLNVEHLTHGFGDRAIFDDVSFRLLKGEHRLILTGMSIKIRKSLYQQGRCLRLPLPALLELCILM